MGNTRNFMSKAVKHPGALRKTLGVKGNERIPAAKLEQAAHSRDPLTRKRAALAKTFRRFSR